MAEWFHTWAETIEHVTVALASIIGGPVGSVPLPQ